MSDTEMSSVESDRKADKNHIPQSLNPSKSVNLFSTLRNQPQEAQPKEVELIAELPNVDAAVQEEIKEAPEEKHPEVPSLPEIYNLPDELINNPDLKVFLDQ